jgi:hypothetical protein
LVRFCAVLGRFRAVLGGLSPDFRRLHNTLKPAFDGFIFDSGCFEAISFNELTCCC